MNKTELIKNIADDSGLTKTQVERVLNSLTNVVTQHLQTSTEDLTLPGLGKLETSVREARKARNPRTGEPIEVPASVAIKFKPAKALKDALN